MNARKFIALTMIMLSMAGCISNNSKDEILVHEDPDSFLNELLTDRVFVFGDDYGNDYGCRERRPSLRATLATAGRLRKVYEDASH